MRHDSTGTLPFPVGDLVKARNIGIGLLLFAIANEVTIRAEARGQVLAMIWVRRARRRSRAPQCLSHRKEYDKAKQNLRRRNGPSTR
jgi:hypothetical protein